MRLGVVSDTHGHVELTRPAIRMLESLEVDRVLHCGDIGSAAVVELFAAWPTDSCSATATAIARSWRRRSRRPGRRATASSASWRSTASESPCSTATMAGGFSERSHSGEWDLVCYGHTHVAAIDRYGQTLAVNPGALYRANPHSLAIVELPALEATIVTAVTSFRRLDRQGSPAASGTTHSPRSILAKIGAILSAGSRTNLA